jgi:HSP20 family protein
MVPDVSKKSLMSLRDDFMERFFKGWPTVSWSEPGMWNPRTDVDENDREVRIDIEVPGMKKEEIKVELKNDVLTISGERKKEKKIEKTEYSREERYYGRFERSFELPDNIESDRISAMYRDGVLTVTVPKTGKPAAKEVPIEVK